MASCCRGHLCLAGSGEPLSGLLWEGSVQNPLNSFGVPVLVDSQASCVSGGEGSPRWLVLVA